MTTNSGDAGSTRVDTAGTPGDPASTAGNTAGSESPYEIGLVTDDARGTDETGPKPLDPEGGNEQVAGDA